MGEIIKDPKAIIFQYGSSQWKRGENGGKKPAKPNIIQNNIVAKIFIENKKWYYLSFFGFH